MLKLLPRQLSKLMKKKKRISKSRRNFILAVIPFVLVLALLSRSVPDGVVRLDIGNSGIGEKAIALTFDDGPGDYTEALLDGLEENGAKVTFFVIGKKAEKYPETVERAYDEGHLIGSHSYDHINLLASSISDIEESINKNAKLIQEITGEKPLFFRAPHGYTTAYQLKRLNTFFVKWSVDSYDWKGKDAEYIYNRIMKKASDGQIILLHDTKEATVEAVLRAIPELQAQGYEFVRVDELLSRNGDKIRMGVPYRKCKYENDAVAF